MNATPIELRIAQLGRAMSKANERGAWAAFFVFANELRSISGDIQLAYETATTRKRP